jgi:hypothetical protein
VFGIIRLVIGPNTVDRVVAVDLLTIIAIAVIGLLAHVANRYIYLDVAKKILQGLAKEEARHKLFFESEYDERVLTDN